MSNWLSWLLNALPSVLLAGLSGALLVDLLGFVRTTGTWLGVLP